MSNPEHYLREELYSRAQNDPQLIDFIEQGALDGMWYWDLEDPTHEWLSPRFCELFGYEYGEIPHTPEWWQENIHPEDLVKAVDAYEKHLADPSHPYDLIARYRHRDGHTVWVRCRGMIIRDDSGKPLRMLGAHTDVTGLMNAREALRRSNEDLEQFAYAASHDLQEPLRAVSNYSSLLADEYKGKLGEEADLYIRYIVDSTARMRAMLDGLLAFSRVGRHEPEFTTVDVEPALDDAIVNLETSINDTCAVLTRGDLPKAVGNTSMLTRLFQNLIGNAIKFRRQGEVPEIHISAEDRGNNVWTFAVRDNGIGLDMNHAARIFVIFQRLVKDRIGTGIGLSICKKIVERHGGRLWVESSPNQGATFYFTLKKPDADEQKAPDPARGGQPAGRVDGPESARSDSDRPVGSGSPRWSRSASVPPRSGTVLSLQEARSRPARHESAESEWPRSVGSGGG